MHVELTSEAGLFVDFRNAHDALRGRRSKRAALAAFEPLVRSIALAFRTEDTLPWQLKHFVKGYVENLAYRTVGRKLGTAQAEFARAVREIGNKSSETPHWEFDKNQKSRSLSS